VTTVTTDDPRQIRRRLPSPSETATTASQIVTESEYALRARGFERALATGDLNSLSVPERLEWMIRVCDYLGLSPLTRPFEFLSLRGERGEPDRIVLYARRDATDQLRAKHRVSIEIVERTRDDASGIYLVRARARMPDGRTDEAVGIVEISRPVGEWRNSPNSDKRHFVADPEGRRTPITGLDLANSVMKAETKAKRRVTLSILGLSFLEEWGDHGGLPVDTPIDVTVEEVEQVDRLLARDRDTIHDTSESEHGPGAIDRLF